MYTQWCNDVKWTSLIPCWSCLCLPLWIHGFGKSAESLRDHTCIIHTHMRTRAPTQTYTYTHAYTRTHTNIHIHTCIHAHPHKHTHAYTGAHTKIHILSFSFNLYASYSDIKITHDTICFLFDTVYLQSVLLCVCVCVWTKQPILFVADSIQCKVFLKWCNTINKKHAVRCKVHWTI